MQQYTVTGMSCAACSARVEKAVSAVDGVTSCSVNLLTHSMGVEGSVDEAAIVAAVEAAGYGAFPKTTDVPVVLAEDEPLRDTETPRLKRRLIASLGFLVPLMYVSMGHTMWGWPLPAFFESNPLATALLQLVLAAVVMMINQRFFISGFRGVLHGAPNMDTLVALGSGAAFVYSTAVLFTPHYAHDLYFESAAMILTLITVGKLLEARSKGKTTNALRELMRLTPKTATVIRDGEELTVAVEQVQCGDVFVVRPGETIPVDGVVLEGHSAVNEAALTGESIPVDKTAGDAVSAATLNQSGFLRCEAIRVGEDTTLAQIIRMVSDAAATKAPIAKLADTVSGVFVPIVMGIALVTVAVWLLTGASVGYALARGIAVLVISCPCALGLATPVAIMVGNGVGAKHGILFKTAASLEQAGKADIVVLDKTGTVTAGEPRVTAVIPAEGISESQLLTMAVSLEQHSEHPLARAVLHEAEKRGIQPLSVESFEALPGHGLRAKRERSVLIGGSMRFIGEQTAIPSVLRERAEQLSENGSTPLMFAQDGKSIGLVAVADAVKPDSAEAVEQLHGMGLRVVMLTGDNERTARAIGREIGVDEIVAEVLPDGKEAVIRSLQEQGRVVMVGDGINDAPALTRADIGMAIGAGTDVALDAADVVLVHSRLSDVAAAIRLSRGTLHTIRQNLFWAFAYNVLGIPLAAGVFIPLFGWELEPMFGALAMSLSSFCVVSNALRLNFIKLHSSTTHTVQKKEEQSMKKVMKIEGMMCPHCSGRVKTVLEALDGVASAAVSHETGTAEVELAAPVEDAMLISTVEAQGYTVVSVE